MLSISMNNFRISRILLNIICTFFRIFLFSFSVILYWDWLCDIQVTFLRGNLLKNVILISCDPLHRHLTFFCLAFLSIFMLFEYTMATCCKGATASYSWYVYVYDYLVHISQQRVQFRCARKYWTSYFLITHVDTQ
jgi:hypothetical protein